MNAAKLAKYLETTKLFSFFSYSFTLETKGQALSRDLLEASEHPLDPWLLATSGTQEITDLLYNGIDFVC